VEHIGTGLGIDSTHYATTDIAKNPITGENYYSETWAPRRNHVMWVKSIGSSTTFNFMAVVFPVAAGDAAPTITRVDDTTVTVSHAGYGINKTISFGDTEADLTVDLDGEPEPPDPPSGSTIEGNLNISGALIVP
jgi:hypothetical protein